MRNNINVVFVYTSEIISENGGVQRVTKFLSDHFKTQNISVCYLSQKKKSKPSKELTNHYFLPSPNLDSIKNKTFFKKLVLKEEIDIIINQAALGGCMAFFCDNAKSVRNVKIISVIHNSLLGNVENLTTSNKKIFNKLPLAAFSFILNTRFFKSLLLKFYILKYKNKYINLYNLSDKVILLSNSYFKELILFVNNATKDKVISIHNPCTVNKPLNLKLVPKKNELLYVGRINTSQKRVDLLLQVWQKIHVTFPDWKLNIVGDGEELEELKGLSKRLKLKRITFLGHKNPVPYYKTAKVLCMTSSYEGFPLVLAEAHNFNVVPVLFNSFPSATDIIRDGENGFLIKPFEIEAYVIKLGELMSNYNKLSTSLYKECEISATKFSIEKIGERWFNLFDELLNSK